MISASAADAVASAIIISACEQSARLCVLLMLRQNPKSGQQCRMMKQEFLQARCPA